MSTTHKRDSLPVDYRGHQFLMVSEMAERPASEGAVASFVWNMNLYAIHPDPAYAMQFIGQVEDDGSNTKELMDAWADIQPIPVRDVFTQECALPPSPSGWLPPKVNAAIIVFESLPDPLTGHSWNLKALLWRPGADEPHDYIDGAGADYTDLAEALVEEQVSALYGQPLEEGGGDEWRDLTPTEARQMIDALGEAYAELGKRREEEQQRLAESMKPWSPEQVGAVLEGAIKPLHERTATEVAQGLFDARKLMAMMSTTPSLAIDPDVFEQLQHDLLVESEAKFLKEYLHAAGQPRKL